MKNRIIFLYFIYAISIYLLSIIDIVILMYYIFWINNIFMIPLFWFIIKIIYFNRCILLLLLFYYLIAKFTIQESGYKYFLFFNIDVRKWRGIYLDYIFSITTYHVEIFSIFIFFCVIILPLFLYNKEVFFLLINLIVFLVFLYVIMKKRIKYIKQEKKKFSFLNFFLFCFFFFIIIKFSTYYNFKDFMITYVHFDKWTFELLEWKTRMYDKLTAKDLYIRTIGLKPVWVGPKFSKEYYFEKEQWKDSLKIKKSWHLYFRQLKKELFLFIEKSQINKIKTIKTIIYIKDSQYDILKQEFKRQCYKWYIYIKYHKHLYYKKIIIYDDIMNKLNKSKNYILKQEKRRSLIFKNKDNLIKIKLYNPKLNLKNENLFVTQEKERERLLHRTVIGGRRISELSFDNYYSLNLDLRDLTLKQLYYQPFIDKKAGEKYKMDQKRLKILTKMRENIKDKNEVLFLKKIIKEYKMFIQKNKQQIIEERKQLSEKWFGYKYYFLKLLDYFLLKYGNEKLIKKREKLDFAQFLLKIKTRIELKEKLNKSFFFISKKEVFNKDRPMSKSQSLGSVNIHMNKEKLERMDNKVLFNTVEKYNKEGPINRKEWLKEFNKVIIKEKKKKSMIKMDGPDLSRRQKK